MKLNQKENKINRNSTIHKINSIKEIYKKEIFYTIDKKEVSEKWTEIYNALIEHVNSFAENINILNTEQDQIMISDTIKYLNSFFNYLGIKTNSNDYKGIYLINNEDYINLFKHWAAFSIYWKTFINESIFSNHDNEYKTYILIHELIHIFTSQNININSKNYWTEMLFTFDDYILIEWLTDFLAALLNIKYYNKNSWNIKASYFHLIKLIDYLVNELSIKSNISYDEIFKYLIKSFFIKENKLDKILLSYFDKWFIKDLNELWKDNQYENTLNNINTVLSKHWFEKMNFENISLTDNFINLFNDFEIK